MNRITVSYQDKVCVLMFIASSVDKLLKCNSLSSRAADKGVGALNYLEWPGEGSWSSSSLNRILLEGKGRFTKPRLFAKFS